MTDFRTVSSRKLPDSQRFQRVAEILCNAILRDEVGPAMQDGEPETLAPSAPPLPELSVADKSDEARIIRYLALVREASPVNIRDTLGLSRSTAWRALRRLTQNRRIVGSGQTRQLVYQLNDGAPPADRLTWN